jgi:hypothetical protein
VTVLCGSQSVTDQGLDGVRALLDQQLDVIPLGLGEPIEDVAGGILAARRAPDAEADAMELGGPQCLLQ